MVPLPCLDPNSHTSLLLRGQSLRRGPEDPPRSPLLASLLFLQVFTGESWLFLVTWTFPSQEIKILFVSLFCSFVGGDCLFDFWFVFSPLSVSISCEKQVWASALPRKPFTHVHCGKLLFILEEIFRTLSLNFFLRCLYAFMGHKTLGFKEQEGP